uniref:DDE-1 domain-containing protein n=1 Tax=Amphimedon queenslandica TaxID=400682 RepID=A0A1X7V771_AMPQE
MSVYLFTAIRWVGQAWSLLTASTIEKCFRKAGILTADLDVVCLHTVDPFSKANELVELVHMIEKTESDVCASNKFANGDDDHPLCAEMDDINWESIFIDDLPNNSEQHDEEQSDDKIEDDVQ